MEKLYTVENIAQMTGLTSRTIRNYIADGRLRGRKIGSQWRFTEADVEALFSQREAAAQMSEKRASIVEDFMKPQSRTGITTCSIIDYPAASSEAASAVCALLNDYISAAGDCGVELAYEYMEEISVGRFIIAGPADHVSKLVKIVRKKG